MERRFFITADLHYGHSLLVNIGDRKQGFEQRINRSFHQLRRGDILLCLGDICIGNDAEAGGVFKALQHKGVVTILVRGNHDHKSDNWYMDHGWTFVCESFFLERYGLRFLFTHIPVWSESDFSPQNPVGVKAKDVCQLEFDVNVHGHFHSSDRKGSAYQEENHFLVEIESNNYNLYSLKEIAREMKDPHHVLKIKKKRHDIIQAALQARNREILEGK